MPTVLGIFRRINGVLSTLCLWLAAFGIVAMTIVVGWQVFGRYVLNDTPTWAEAATLQLMGWFIILGAAVGVRESFHLGVDIVQHVAPPAVSRVMEMVTHLVVIAFGVAMFWNSLELTIGTWAATIPVLGLPGGFDYMPQVFGGILFALFGSERLVERIVGVQHQGVAVQEVV